MRDWRVSKLSLLGGNGLTGPQVHSGRPRSITMPQSDSDPSVGGPQPDPSLSFTRAEYCGVTSMSRGPEASYTTMFFRWMARSVSSLLKTYVWGIHLTQAATRCCGRAKASTKKRIPRLLLWRGVGLRSASDSRSCRPKAATAMNSRVGRLGGHSHDSRNLTFLFRSREATTHRVYLNEVDTKHVCFDGC